MASSGMAWSTSGQEASCDLCDLADLDDLLALAQSGMGIMCDPSCLDGDDILLCNALGLVSSTRAQRSLPTVMIVQGKVWRRWLKFGGFSTSSVMVQVGLSEEE